MSDIDADEELAIASGYEPSYREFERRSGVRWRWIAPLLLIVLASTELMFSDLGRISVAVRVVVIVLSAGSLIRLALRHHRDAGGTPGRY